MVNALQKHLRFRISLSLLSMFSHVFFMKGMAFILTTETWTLFQVLTDSWTHSRKMSRNIRNVASGCLKPLCLNWIKPSGQTTAQHQRLLNYIFFKFVRNYIIDPVTKKLMNGPDARTHAKSFLNLKSIFQAILETCKIYNQKYSLKKIIEIDYLVFLGDRALLCMYLEALLENLNVMPNSYIFIQ